MTHLIILLIFLIACSQAITRKTIRKRCGLACQLGKNKNPPRAQSGANPLKNPIEEVLQELLSSWRSPIEEESVAEGYWYEKFGTKGFICKNWHKPKQGGSTSPRDCMLLSLSDTNCNPNIFFLDDVANNQCYCAKSRSDNCSSQEKNTYRKFQIYQTHQNNQNKALPECIQVSGSPAEQKYCDGIYKTTSKISTEGTCVYVNRDTGEKDRYLYWSPRDGGRWQIDSDVNAEDSNAYFPKASQSLPVSSGKYYIKPPKNQSHKIQSAGWTEVPGSKIEICNDERRPPNSNRRSYRRRAIAAEDNVALPSSWRNRIEEESLGFWGRRSSKKQNKELESIAYMPG